MTKIKLKFVIFLNSCDNEIEPWSSNWPTRAVCSAMVLVMEGLRPLLVTPRAKGQRALAPQGENGGCKQTH